MITTRYLWRCFRCCDEMLTSVKQLNLQMMAGLTFPYYSEAMLTFDPTYKFDIGRDIYDTS